MLVERQLVEIEAEKAVDLFLIEHAVGAAAHLVLGRAGAAIEHGRPFGRHVLGVVAARALLGERGPPFFGERFRFVVGHSRGAYWSRSSLNRIASTLAG